MLNAYSKPTTKTADTEGHPMKLSVLTYNTLFAGRDGGVERRARAQIDLINDLRPDVFLMQEAKGFDANGGVWLYALERQIGMRGFLAVAPRTGQNVAIFIREPLRPLGFEADGAHFHHALATLKVALPDSDTPITFISAHLCPNGPEMRRREAAFLAVHAAPDTLTLITGDFNSASPHDPEPADWSALPAHHRARYLAEDLCGIDHSVLARLEAAGWVDLGHRLDAAKVPTVPTAAFAGTEFATMRCDYLLASQDLAGKAKSYQVIRNAVTDAASDHYPVLRHSSLTMSKTEEGAFAAPENGMPKGWLNRTVVGAGITSALGDFCYETTTVILPGFLAALGIPAAALGIIEGIADAVAAFTKMVSGYIADKLGHRKLLVLVGYGLTPVGQALIALALGWPLLLLGRIVSWFGKGLRGPLRDAIVIQAVTPETRGRAFGFHRAADTVGAVAGPLLGVALLGWAQGLHWDGVAGPFRLVLWFSVIPGALAVLAFLTLVKDPQHSPNPALKFFGSLRGLPSRFKRYLGAVGIFGIGDFSHSLLILAATTLLTPSLGVVQAAQVAGLLYVWRNIVQVAVSFPVGVAADRIGHLPVLIAGYVLGVLTAVMTALAFWFAVDSIVLLAGIFSVAGLYVAVQEALESTVTAEMVQAETLAISYGALGTVNGVAKFVSSATVGVVWTVVSPTLGFVLAAALMATGTLALSRQNRDESQCNRRY
jgi:MFS family permease/endonuclease/exonuclease/phosphatase family metal-dependent hydrolase